MIGVVVLGLVVLDLLFELVFLVGVNLEIVLVMMLLFLFVLSIFFFVLWIRDFVWLGCVLKIVMCVVCIFCKVWVLFLESLLIFLLIVLFSFVFCFIVVGV